jgi:hypothetical protein
MVVTVLVTVLCVLVLVAAVLVVADLVWWRRLMMRRRVMVNLTSGRAVSGVLRRRFGRTLVLVQAQVFEPGAEPAGMDGDVVIDRAQVDFTQVAP